MGLDARPTWNPSAWLEEKSSLRGIYHARLSRAKVWQNTLDIIRAGGYATAGGKVVDIAGTDAMLSGTRVYAAPPDVSSAPQHDTTYTWVENADCLFLGKKLMDMGLNPAVLCYSSQDKACGDVDKGVKGQEQDICRRTDITLAYSQHFTQKWSDLLGVENKGNAYPLDGKYGCVYTPDVMVFRAPEMLGYTLLADPFRLAVISCGAVDRRMGERTDEEWKDLMQERMRTVFRAGLDNGHDSLVLGAWGCGPHGGPVDLTARLFHEVMREPEFRNRFRVVVFACAENPKKNPARRKYTPFHVFFGSDRFFLESLEDEGLGSYSSEWYGYD